MRTSVDSRPSLDSKAPETDLITLTHANRLPQIKELLENNPNLEITKIKDLKLYSLLHICCMNDQLNICKFLFSHLENRGASQEEIENWVNAQTDEGFAAIHFASFKGNIDLLKLLEEYGANINIKNHRGLNILHIAAQGDQPISIAYYIEKGLNIHSKDSNGSTPLHWAAYFAMENATYFLTSWGCDPNEKDYEFGCTPLHLAVSSGNMRVVRRLLLKGADKNIRNNEGKTPLEVAVENEYDGIADLLRPRNWFVAFFNIKPELSNKRKRSSLFTLIFLYILMIPSNVLFVFPFSSNKIWEILFLVFQGASLLFFLCTWLKDPGYMSKKKEENVCSLLLRMRNSPHRVCADCVIIKPDRSKHCEICNTCVAVYDHHCPWVNNCIGAQNYKYFVLFILSTLSLLVFLLVFSIIHIQVSDIQTQYSWLNLTDPGTFWDLKEGVCAANFVLIVLFFVPLSGLNYLHLGNLWTGKTTTERFGYKATTETLTMSNLAVDSRDSQYVRLRSSKKKRGILKNCISMCYLNESNPKYNSF